MADDAGVTPQGAEAAPASPSPAPNESQSAASEAKPELRAESQPAFDPEALQAQMQAAVRSGIQSYAEETARAYAQQQQAQADPLAQYVTQAVAPYLGAVGIEARSALDAANFYSTADPEENLYRAKIRAKVEELHMQARQQGQFFPRETILAYLRGGPLRKEFEEEIVQRHQQKLREAEEAAVAGAGSARARGTGPTKSPYDMTPEELEAFLGNTPF